jgi:hypothetical protein
MIILFIISVFALIAWWARNLYFRNIVLKYRYKLYAFRDTLRLAVIEKEIESSSFTFELLDESISKSIQYLDCLNIYTLAYLSVKMNKNINYRHLSQNISRKLNDDESLLHFYKEFNLITHNFIKERFFISFFIFRLIQNYLTGFNRIIEMVSHSFWNLALLFKVLPQEKEKPIPVLIRSLLI